MGKTGTWIWPERYSDLKVVEVKSSDIDFIKSLIVGWDVLELGSPSLMTKNGYWLYDVFEEKPKLEQLLQVFFNQATLDKNSTSYNNPLVNNNLDQSFIDEVVYGIPNQEIKQKVITNKIIDVEQTDALLKLWQSCHLKASGFEPKRGFLLANLQEVIDPKKLLSKTEIIKQRKYFKSLLFIYLQLFIKEAKMETGFYHSYDHYTWIKGRDFGIAKELTLYEWNSRINFDFNWGISEFNKLLIAISKVLSHLQSKRHIDYQNIASIFNFDDLFKYDHDNINRTNIDLEEILLKALEHFPEEKSFSADNKGFTILLQLTRVYNAQGKFEQAKQLMQENNIYLFSKKQLDFFCKAPDQYQQIAFYESCICEMVSTGNYELWKFPSYPKFTEEEIRKYNIQTKPFFLDNPEEKKRYELEKKKIEKLLSDRATLDFDLRAYLTNTYHEDLEINFNYLKEINKITDLDEITASLLNQIYLLHRIHNYKS